MILFISLVLMRKKPITDENGAIIQTRPKKQDSIPKAFQTKPFVMLQISPPLTDRYMLWFLYHYPYFNGYLIQDWASWMPHAVHNPNGKYAEAQFLIASLERRGFIEQNRQRTAWGLTTRGHLYRFTSHPNFQFYSLLITVLATISVGTGVFIAERSYPIKDELPQTSLSISTAKKQKTADSVRYNPAQTVSLKVKDSFLKNIDSSKTNKINTTKE